MSSSKPKKDQIKQDEKSFETPARGVRENLNEFGVLSPKTLTLPKTGESPQSSVNAQGRSFQSIKGVKKVTVLNKQPNKVQFHGLAGKKIKLGGKDDQSQLKLNLNVINKDTENSPSISNEISIDSTKIIKPRGVQDNLILNHDLQATNEMLQAYDIESARRNGNDKSVTAHFTENTITEETTPQYTEMNSPRGNTKAHLQPFKVNPQFTKYYREQKTPEKRQQKTEFTGSEKDKLIAAQRAKERYEQEYQRNLDALQEINKNPSIPKMRTFDNRTREVIPKMTDDNKYSGLQYFPQKFNFNSFEFFQQESNEWKLAEYQKQFIIAENCKDNQQKIFNQLVELAFIQATEQIDNSEELKDIPKLFNENKKQFFKMLVKSHKMQRFFQQFNDHFQVIMKKEILKNYKGIDLYLRHPRQQGRSLSPSRLYPSLNEVKWDVQKEEKYVKQSYDTAREKFNYTKQRKDKREKQFKKHIEKQQKFKNELFEEEKKDEPKRTQKEIMALGVISKWKKHSKPKKKVYSDFQMALMESTSKVDAMISQIDENNIDIRNEVNDTKEQLERLENESKRNNNTAFPGAKISSMMEKWGKEAVISADDNKKFSNELWVSLEEFEKQLKDEIKGHTIMHREVCKDYELQIKRLKDFTSFRIEALESALIKTKMKSNTEREQLMMQIEEMESVKFNTQNKAEGIDSFIQQLDAPKVFKSVVEARVVVEQLTKTLKINRKSAQINEDKVRDLTFMIDQTNAKCKSIMDQQELQNDLRKYYQTLVLKLVRDLEIFKNDEENGEKFEEIDELNPDLEQQKSIMQTLKEINLNVELINYANKFFGQAESLEQLQEQISEMRVQKNAAFGGTSPSKGRNSSMKLVVSSAMKNNKINKKQKSKVEEINQLQSGDETPLTVRSGVNTPTSFATRGGFSIFQKEKLMGLIRQGIQGYLEIPKATATSGLPDPPEVIEAKKAKKVKRGAKKKVEQKGREKSKFQQNQKTLEETLDKDLNDDFVPRESKGQAKPISRQNSSQQIMKIEIDDEPDSIPSLSLNSEKGNDSPRQVTQVTKRLQIQKVKEIESPSKKAKEIKSPVRKQSTKESPERQQSPQKSSANQVSNQTNKILSKLTKVGTKNLYNEAKKKSESPSKANQGSNQTMKILNKLAKVGTKNLYNEAQKKVQQTAKGERNSQPQSQRNEGNNDTHSQESSVDRNTLRLVESQLQNGGGICAIDHELDELVMPQYAHLNKKVQDMLTENSKIFNFEAQQIQEVQNMVQASLGKKLDFDDNQSLFNSDIDAMIKSFQIIIEKQFGFEPINQLIMKGQQKPEDSSPYKKESVNFGDILKPVISETGEFLGLQLRPQLAKSMILGNKLQLTHIKKMMKICLFVNRLIKDGKEDEFLMKQIKPGQDRKPFKEIEIQVDVEELQANVEIIEKDRETPEEMDVNEQVLQMLKNHAIDIMTRMNPDKKGYYKMVWEDMDLQKLLYYKLNDVFKDRKGEQEDKLGEGLPFGQYLQYFFQFINSKLHEIGLNQNQKKRLVLEDFVSMGKIEKKPIHIPQPMQVVIDVEKFEKSCQATVSQYDACVMTGQELMPEPQIIREESPPKGPLTRSQRIQMKGKNQLILDKAMEEELVKTMNLFDSYVTEITRSEKIQDIAEKAAKKYEKQKDKIEVHKYFSNMDISKKKFKRGFDVDIRINSTSPKFMSGSNSGSDDTDYEYDLSKLRNKLMKQIQNLKEDTKKKKVQLFPNHYDDSGSARFPKTSKGSMAGITGFQSSMQSDANKYPTQITESGINNYHTQNYGSRELTQNDSYSNSQPGRDINSKILRQNMTADLEFSPRKKDSIQGNKLGAGKKSLMIKGPNKQNLPSISFDLSSQQNVPGILMASINRDENYQKKQFTRNNNLQKHLQLQTLNQDIKYQENIFFGSKTKPQTKAMNTLVPSPVNTNMPTTARINQSSSRFRRTANKTQMPKHRPNKDGENAFQEFIRYKQNQTSQRFNEETQTNDKSISIHLDINASQKRETENDQGSQGHLESLKYISDTEQSTQKKETIMSVPSVLIDQVVTPRQGFKWLNKNAEQNWNNAQKMTSRTHKKNIVSQSIDVTKIQRTQRMGNLSTVENQRNRIVVPIALNQQSGPRIMPMISPQTSTGGVSLKKSKQSYQHSSQLVKSPTGRKVSHKIDVAINEETSSQAVTRFQLYPSESRNVENLKVQETIPLQKEIQSQMYEPSKLSSTPIFVPRLEAQNNLDHF